MNLKLPPSVYSADQIMLCAEELHAYAITLAERRHRNETGGEAPALSAEAADLLLLLPEEKRQDDVMIEGLRAELEQLLEKNRAVTLTLAAPAAGAIRGELVAWVRENLGDSVLVNFRVDPDIAGGVIIRTPSYIYDCSFRTRLLEYPEKFTQVLEHV